MASPEYISGGIRVEIFNWNSEVILLGLYDSSKLGVYDNEMLVVADSSKLGE